MPSSEDSMREGQPHVFLVCDITALVLGCQFPTAFGKVGILSILSLPISTRLLLLALKILDSILCLAIAHMILSLGHYCT